MPESSPLDGDNHRSGIRALGLDPGYGAFKVAEVTPEGVKSVHLPSVVGAGQADAGLLSLGSLSSRRGLIRPHLVTFDGSTFLVGSEVAHYAQPIARMDLLRLADGPEARALLYASLGALLGPGSHRVTLLVGLPVVVMGDRNIAAATLRALRSWVVGAHAYGLDGTQATLHVEQVQAMAQPAGAYFAWGLDDAGHWVRRSAELQAPAAICDIGFNTVDLFAVQAGQVLTRYTGGDQLGMRRAAELLAQSVVREYGVHLSSHEADALLRERRPQLYTSDGETDISGISRQALQVATGTILEFIEARWGNGRQFSHLIFTGGGSTALREPLLRHYPHGHMPPDPVLANVCGLARYARRSGRPASEDERCSQVSADANK